MKKRKSAPAGKRKVTKAKQPTRSRAAAAKVSAGASADLLASEQNPKAPKIKLKGKVYDRVPFKSENPDWLCIDCEAADGKLHDLGCDTENCPRCGGQLIGCGCLPIPD